MAASSPSRTSRKFLFLGFGIIVFVAIYSAGWFYAAQRLQETVIRTLAPGGAASVSGECRDIAFRGYPFRIGLFCSKVDVKDTRNDVTASFGALRSAAQIYSPGHIVWELDSPATIQTGHGLGVTAQWANLQSSLTTKLKGIDRTSLVIDGLKATAVSSVTDQTIDFDAAKTEVHLRQNGPDLDGAITLTDASTVIKGWPQLLPRLNAIGDITLAGKAGMIDGSDRTGLYGASGELRRVMLDIGDGRTMRITGPFSFDDQGYLSGQFKLEIEKLGEWADNAKQTFPQLQSTIDTARKLLRALAGGGDRASVDLVVDRGRATVSGFIPLGKIPPI
ncbi:MULTISPECIES: DUF2125 domain-containing protein [Agrobacterium]|uniref:DUF2125 domain-containing protein n=1 Tax=Agrobacterium rosae TaxID=1972867 RepID=A0A1R3TF60_9HYPH|nr:MULTISPECIES: DUF2125 domain-containing protein [Agrobacterium]KAA3515773.1 DUF2125 domain-containing protein [Agrobacterium rosae]KAA3524732.1 DUF2125 domain-containing protein [Agrobacterium rosae]MBN7803926.1 DUF2125 domain-containing protein [Agrobacterium rosae]MCM2431682.1 DUF2125 domain-containing protein [Agrobacterium rosae]MDX8302646.1 DUF2125 domain-containing protein [Agrobacterium rosae]